MKFKVGDRVEIVGKALHKRSCLPDDFRGRTGVLTGEPDDDDDRFCVRLDGGSYNCWYVHPSDLKLLFVGLNRRLK